MIVVYIIMLRLGRATVCCLELSTKNIVFRVSVIRDYENCPARSLTHSGAMAAVGGGSETRADEAVRVKADWA